MKLIFCAAIILTLTSCLNTRYINSPVPANAPYFSQKGQLESSFYYSTGKLNPVSENRSNGFDLLAAYAISNHIAVTLDYSYRREKDIVQYNSSRYSTSDSFLAKYRRNSLNIGIGYFKAINDEKRSFVNIYAGIGLGQTAFRDTGIFDNTERYSTFHNARVTKLYIQPGFTFFSDKKISCAIATKFSFSRYSSIQTNYSEQRLSEVELIDLGKEIKFFLEPS